jgi:hypothetical protein
MARRINYGFEKRQKEAKRKKKQEEKLEKKRLSKEGAAAAVPVDGEAVPATDADGVPVNESTTTSEEVPS